MRLLLIDGNSLLYRSYFGLAQAGLTTSEGIPTGCTLAFLRTVISAIRVHEATHIFVAFDSKGRNTIRHKAYKEYKATRKPKKFNLSEDFKVVKKTLDMLNIVRHSDPLYEADDIVGTMVEKYKDEAEYITILGGDKDYAQLVDDNVFLYMFSSATKGFENMGPEAILNKFGVHPNQIVDYLTLVGDKSDNLPGVEGIGKKGAPPLLEKYGSIKEIYKNLDDFTAKKKEKFIASKQNARLTYKLATIFKQVPLEHSLEDIEIGNLYWPGWKDVIDWLELESLKEEVNLLETEFYRPKKSLEDFDTLYKSNK